VVNKSEPEQKGKKSSRGGNSRGVMVVETAVVEKPWWKQEEDNILFYNYKKKGQFKLSLFLVNIGLVILCL
jgi:hypothetical protein